MTIFRIKSKKIVENQNRGVTVVIPQHVGSVLTLHCLANEISKTSVVKGLLEQWKAEHQDTKPLIDVLIIKAKEQYEYSRKRCPGVSLLSFQNDLFRELKQKGIDMEAIKTIVNQIK